MRNIISVIEEVKIVVPFNEYDFHKILDWLRDDVSYKAPEQMGECWIKFSEIMTMHIPPPPTEDWHFKALSIFSVTPEENIREAFQNPELEADHE